jgi:hypothetical protein
MLPHAKNDNSVRFAVIGGADRNELPNQCTHWKFRAVIPAFQRNDPSPQQHIRRTVGLEGLLVDRAVKPTAEVPPLVRVAPFTQTKTIAHSDSSDDRCIGIDQFNGS